MSDAPSPEKKPGLDHAAIEEQWRKYWAEQQIYAYNPQIARQDTFAIDTPPPTVSGSLHIGHVFSYVHTDIFARYQRMLGKNIFYPMGFDDNGLPTERRVQNVFNITCDANLQYQPGWKPQKVDSADKNKKKDAKINYQPVARQNFIEACRELTTEDEEVFKQLWQHIALSVDWNEEYSTINKHCISTSQQSFLLLVDKGIAYQREAPTIWDSGFRTAVAQAELEDRETNGAFHDLKFAIDNSDEYFTISTTRPELLAACIAVAAHPDDERYKRYFGQTALTPLYHVPVPIIASTHADPTKGTGILMICTFGDAADLTWWKASNFPCRMLIGRDGCMLNIDFGQSPFESRDIQSANANYAEIAGKNLKQAKKIVVEQLRNAGKLLSEPRQIAHAVKFYEKGDVPVEYVSSRQWYCRILDFKDTFIQAGQAIQWHPEHMRHRYENWVQGLNQDWCISRQRFFGVPFPVWYRLDAQGQIDYDQPIFATPDMLPVDPMSMPAPGFSEDQRNQPGGFVGDPDVMDTWATSSLTPQIATNWIGSDGRFAKLFPMDVRPQSHEIIRTWAFYTIAKALYHTDASQDITARIPWKNVSISGWILDPDRKKMAKSVGNVITPQGLLDTYSADAVRYWAGRARLGIDTAFDEKIMKNGRQLTVKIFNAARYVMGQLEMAGVSIDAIPAWSSDNLSVIDREWSKQLATLIEQATRSFADYNHAGALEKTEQMFWNFCDNYIEFTKPGIRTGDVSSLPTLVASISVFMRLFAPFMPYISEEIWHNFQFDKRYEAKSVHLAKWPSSSEFVNLPECDGSYDLLCTVVHDIRSHRTQTKNYRSIVTNLELALTAAESKLYPHIVSYLASLQNIECSANLKLVDDVPENRVLTIDFQAVE